MAHGTYIFRGGAGAMIVSGKDVRVFTALGAVATLRPSLFNREPPSGQAS
jgi:hypothetical protein